MKIYSEEFDEYQEITCPKCGSPDLQTGEKDLQHILTKDGRDSSAYFTEVLCMACGYDWEEPSGYIEGRLPEYDEDPDDYEEFGPWDIP